MKRQFHFLLLLILFVTCKPDQKIEHQDIFGEWTVVDAKFIQPSNLKGNSIRDTKSLSDNYLRYKYVFNYDSTFHRGKPDVRHSNVEEAHGRFSITKNKKVMRWFLKWTHLEKFDTVDVEIVKMSSSTMVLLEAMGGGNKMEHTLERLAE